MVILGLGFIGLAMFLRQGTADAHQAITNITSVFILVAGALCILFGIVIYLIKNDEDDGW
jgi:hypothetical protein